MKLNIDNDQSNLTTGVWGKFGDSSFLVCHSSNPRFGRLFARLQAPHKSAIARGDIDPKTSKEIVVKSLAGACVMNWKDVVDGKGKDVPFSIAACEAALANNEDFREWVQAFSTDLANFRHEEIKTEGEV